MMQEHFYSLYVFTLQSNGGVTTTPLLVDFERDTPPNVKQTNTQVQKRDFMYSIYVPDERCKYVHYTLELLHNETNSCLLQPTVSEFEFMGFLDVVLFILFRR